MLNASDFMVRMAQDIKLKHVYSHRLLFVTSIIIHDQRVTK